MSAIRFFTTPKGYLPHYSYIFRNPEPLGIEMKNMDCYMLRIMLYPDTLKGNGAMKKSDLQKYLVWTEV